MFKMIFKVFIVIVIINVIISVIFVGCSAMTITNNSLKDTGLSFTDIFHLSSAQSKIFENSMHINSARLGKEAAKTVSNFLNNFISYKDLEYTNSNTPKVPYPYSDSEAQSIIDKATKEGLQRGLDAAGQK